MKKNTILLFLTSFCCLLFTCSKEEDEMNDNTFPNGTTQIPPSSQRMGDAAKGYEYLVNGDYLNAGVPYSIFNTVYGQDHSNYLGRSGDNAMVKYEFTAVDAPNGVRVVAPNCLQCHASTINGQFIVGLGNAGYDFSQDQSALLPLLESAVGNLYGQDSPEWEAFDPFRKAVKTLESQLITEVRGVNVADKLALVLAAHRDKETLQWKENSSFNIPNELTPTDIPPWWVLKKKNAMFYTGTGRGDFSRYLMLSILLTMQDSAKANEVDKRFPDILAYIKNLQPPVYPGTINSALAEEGKMLFRATCSKCHGTYEDDIFYPNLLVSLDVVQTDPLLSESYKSGTYNSFSEWFNTGWFGKNPNGARLVSEGGYVAQPLDGIWASAPYLHNGSVPALEDLLNSTQRPAFWKRTFDTSDYDFEKVGWNYTELSSKVDNETYDTTIPGYGNQGHTFGDPLTSEQRKAVIEYLKTL